MILLHGIKEVNRYGRNSIKEMLILIPFRRIRCCLLLGCRLFDYLVAVCWLLGCCLLITCFFYYLIVVFWLLGCCFLITCLLFVWLLVCWLFDYLVAVFLLLSCWLLITWFLFVWLLGCCLFDYLVVVCLITWLLVVDDERRRCMTRQLITGDGAARISELIWGSGRSKPGTWREKV